MAQQHRAASKQHRWLALINLWLTSNLSIRAFCKLHHLSEPSFYSWRRVLTQRGLLPKPTPKAAPSRCPQATAKAKAKACPPAFVKLIAVPEPDPPATAATALELVLDQRSFIRVPSGFDPD